MKSDHSKSIDKSLSKRNSNIWFLTFKDLNCTEQKI